MSDFELVTVWSGSSWRLIPTPPQPVQPVLKPPLEITSLVRAWLKAHPTYWMTTRDLAREVDAPPDLVANRLWYLRRIGVVDQEARTCVRRVGGPHRRYAYRWRQELVR